jgi:hypothetical protein
MMMYDLGTGIGMYKKIDGVFKKIKVVEDQDGTKSIKICND